METFCLIEKFFDWKAAFGAVAKTHQPGILKKSEQMCYNCYNTRICALEILGMSIWGHRSSVSICFLHGKLWQHIAKCNSFDQSIPLIPPLSGQYSSYPSVHCSSLRES